MEYHNFFLRNQPRSADRDPEKMRRPNETRIGGDCSRSIESRPRRRPETSQLNILVVPALTHTRTHTHLHSFAYSFNHRQQKNLRRTRLKLRKRVSPDNLLQCFLVYFFFCFFFSFPFFCFLFWPLFFLQCFDYFMFF